MFHDETFIEFVRIDLFWAEQCFYVLAELFISLEI